MPKNNELQIIKWNIYNAKVPFTTNFSKSKNRPIIVIAIVGADVVVLPISSKIQKKNKWDIIINLDKPSLIKVANIQSINKNDLRSPYYSLKTKRIFKIYYELQNEIKDKLVELLINKKRP